MHGLIFLPLACFIALINAFDLRAQDDSGTSDDRVALATLRQGELKEWLNQRRLYPLLKQVLEDELASSSDREQRRQTAGQLAQLYAWQLNTGGQPLGDINRRLDELLDEFPDAIPLQTQTGIAFGRYRSAKDAFESWIWDRGNVELRSVAAAGFADVIRSAEEMTERWRELEASSEQIQQQQLNAALSQVIYLAAWSRYYESQTLNDTTQQRRLLLLAEADFLELLTIADRDEFIKLTPQWFPLTSEWSCRLILGMGMVSQSLGNLDQAEFAFNLLTEHRVPISIRTNRRVWRFHSMLFPGQLVACNQLVGRWRDASEDIGADIPFWSTVAMAGLSWPDPADEKARQLTLAGMTGLARANEFVVIDDLLMRYPVEIAGDGFFAHWLAGYALILRAETGASDVQRATGLLSAALDQDRERIAPVYRARCRYHFGFALYLNADFAAAADQFRQAVAALEQLDPVLAEHAEWMQCQSLYQLANTDVAWKPALGFQLRQFLARWPNSTNAPQAAFMQIMHDLDEQSAEQAIATLATLMPDNINYERARFEVCRLIHRLWSEIDQADREPLAKEMISAADKYVSTVSQPAVQDAWTRYATVCLLAADVMLNRQQSDAAGAQRWLDEFRSVPQDIRNQREAASEFRYLNLSLATMRGDVDAQRDIADWLLNHGARPAHVRAALISRARLLEDELQASQRAAPRNIQLIDQAITIYGRLVDKYEAAGITLDQEPALVVARRRLGELATLSDRPDEALQQYRILHEAWPDELTYMLGIARSQMSLGNLPAAAGFWRTISAGLPSGDDFWLEAQYNLMLCLANTQPRQALNVYEQTTLLVPDLPEPWRGKMQQLEADIRQQLQHNN